MLSRSNGTISKSKNGLASLQWPVGELPGASRKLLADGDHHLARETDTEIIMHEISRELSGDRRPTLIEVIRKVSERFDGAYSIVS